MSFDEESLARDDEDALFLSSEDRLPPQHDSNISCFFSLSLTLSVCVCVCVSNDDDDDVDESVCACFCLHASEFFFVFEFALNPKP